MKKIIIILTVLLSFNLLYAEYSAFEMTIISEETDNINGTVLIKTACVFKDTVYWDFSSEYELPEGLSWSIVQNTSINGQTFYPNDSIIINYTLTYDTNDLPFYPKEIKIKIPIQTNTIVSAMAKIHFTPYNTVELWNIFDFYSLPRRWYQNNEQTLQTKIYIPKIDIPVSDINVDSVKAVINAGGLPDEDIVYSEINLPGLAYLILMEPIPEDTTQGGEKANFTGTIVSTLQTQIINDLNEPVSFPLAGIKVELFDYDQNSFDDKLGEGYTNEDGVCTITYSSSQWMQFEQGDLELYVKYSSKDNEYSIRSLHGLSYYKTQSSPNLIVPETAGTRYITHTLIGNNDSNNDAFRAVHWARNGYQFFENKNVNLCSNGLKIYINKSSSFYNSVANYIYLNDQAGDWENTIYHEFGHHVHDCISDMPCSGSGSGGTHSWDEENSIQLAWVEGWASAVHFILDAFYWSEDHEYGTYKRSILPDIEFTRKQILQDVNCGFKSEYIVAAALYDLWDGPNNIPGDFPEYLSTNIEGLDYHAWNDSTTDMSNVNKWNSIDNIELDIYEICRPLIENTGDNKIKNIQEYFDELMENIGDDFQLRADVSRAFRENRMLYNIDENEWGGNVNSMSSDNLLTQYLISEANWPCVWIEENFKTDNLNNRNGNSNNSYSLLAYPDNTNVITDPVWLGASGGWHTELLFNNTSDGSNLQHGIFSTSDNLLIDIVDGQIHLGGNSTSADLSITDGSLLRVRNWSEGLVVNNNSTLYIESGGTLIIEKFSDILIKGNGKIIIEPGAYVCISPDAEITFETLDGYIYQLMRMQISDTIRIGNH